MHCEANNFCLQNELEPGGHTGLSKVIELNGSQDLQSSSFADRCFCYLFKFGVFLNPSWNEGEQLHNHKVVLGNELRVLF